jgi:ribonucleoside-diphosphate reductase alpha chain
LGPSLLHMASSYDLSPKLFKMSSDGLPFVIKRNGTKEKITLDKITARIYKLAIEGGLDTKNLKLIEVIKTVIDGVCEGIRTRDLDDIAAKTCAYKSTDHHDYGILAARIEASNLQKETKNSFSETVHDLYHYRDVNDKHKPVVTKEFYEDVMANRDALDAAIVHERDYDWTYFGLKTVEGAYLLKCGDKVVERPQYMLMRVAVALHQRDMTGILETYECMSKRYYIHASPTLFNAGTHRAGYASCFLCSPADDSIEGMYDLAKECASISKHSGGIGIQVHDIRAKGSRIHSSNGTSEGIIPYLRVLNNVMRHVTQSSRRPGSMAVYLEPTHPEIIQFIELRNPNGSEEMRARDLWLALWIPDLFMEKVLKDDDWCLFCPDEAPGLSDVFGDEYKELYERYEREGRYRKKIKAREIMDAAIHAQIATGAPYMSSKDSVNRKSNQKHIGTIKSSNLCVAPETRILTKDGHKVISELEGQRVEVWNGAEFSEVVVQKTNEDAELMKLTFSNGSELECTPYHKFYVATFNKWKECNGQVIKDAQDLTQGDKLIKAQYPTILHGKKDFKHPYASGLFTADGTYHKNGDKRSCKRVPKQGDKFCYYHRNYDGDVEEKHDGSCTAITGGNLPSIRLYGEKAKLKDYLPVRTIGKPTENGVTIMLPHDLPEKYSVPLDCDLETRLRWLEGFMDGDGVSMFCPETGSYSIQMASIHKEFLNDVRLMLQTMGIDTKMVVMSDARQTMLPNGKGGSQLYDCKKAYRLLLTGYDVYHLWELGLCPKRLSLEGIKRPKKSTNRYVTLLSSENTGRRDATYCFNEPKKHMGIFNGLVTGNCNEITIISDPDEIGVCILASIGLPSFMRKDPQTLKPTFDHDALRKVVHLITRNLNKVIDRTDYPVEKARRSNLRHRPIGIGVSGLADLFCLMRVPFESREAADLNRQVFETIYYAACEESCRLASIDGPYESYEGSEFSKGRLQFDLWDPSNVKLSGRWDWDELKQRIRKHGMRNSLLTACMPTATTSQILGYSECIEPYSSNIYLRKVISGEFQVINAHLLRDLGSLGLWNDKVRKQMILHNGSIQKIKGIPEGIKELYKTTWEIKQRVLIDLSADRGPFIDQTQSLNLFKENPTYEDLLSAHFYGWRKGLKTMMYYLKMAPAAEPIKFTLQNMEEEDEDLEEIEVPMVCRIDDPSCASCSG